ncbi:MAG: hypothetical protein ACI9XK_001950 [Granulosicoccus sp.]|jgi:hypothetical protein
MTSKQINLDHPANDAPTPGIYRHYKGNLYQVLGLARHSETEESLVVYQALYGEKGYWLRPLTLWLDPVNNSADAANGKEARIAARFELVDSNDTSLDELTKHS